MHSSLVVGLRFPLPSNIRFSHSGLHWLSCLSPPNLQASAYPVPSSLDYMHKHHTTNGHLFSPASIMSCPQVSRTVCKRSILVEGPDTMGGLGITTTTVLSCRCPRWREERCVFPSFRLYTVSLLLFLLVLFPETTAPPFAGEADRWHNTTNTHNIQERLADIHSH